MKLKDIPVGAWLDDMIRCPSQCYRREVVGGVDYVLYLRWRWDDPWQAHIVKCLGDDAFSLDDLWTKDIFLSIDLEYTEDKVNAAKNFIEIIFDAIKPILGNGKLERGE